MAEKELKKPTLVTPVVYDGPKTDYAANDKANRVLESIDFISRGFNHAVNNLSEFDRKKQQAENDVKSRLATAGYGSFAKGRVKELVMEDGLKITDLDDNQLLSYQNKTKQEYIEKIKLRKESFFDTANRELDLHQVPLLENMRGEIDREKKIVNTEAIHDSTINNFTKMKNWDVSYLQEELPKGILMIGTEIETKSTQADAMIDSVMFGGNFNKFKHLKDPKIIEYFKDVPGFMEKVAVAERKVNELRMTQEEKSYDIHKNAIEINLDAGVYGLNPEQAERDLDLLRDKYPSKITEIHSLRKTIKKEVGDFALVDKAAQNYHRGDMSPFNNPNLTPEETKDLTEKTFTKVTGIMNFSESIHTMFKAKDYVRFGDTNETEAADAEEKMKFITLVKRAPHLVPDSVKDTLNEPADSPEGWIEQHRVMQELHASTNGASSSLYTPEHKAKMIFEAGLAVNKGDKATKDKIRENFNMDMKDLYDPDTGIVRHKEVVAFWADKNNPAHKELRRVVNGGFLDSGFQDNLNSMYVEKKLQQQMGLYVIGGMKPKQAFSKALEEIKSMNTWMENPDGSEVMIPNAIKNAAVADFKNQNTNQKEDVFLKKELFEMASELKEVKEHAVAMNVILKPMINKFSGEFLAEKKEIQMSNLLEDHMSYYPDPDYERNGKMIVAIKGEPVAFFTANMIHRFRIARDKKITTDPGTFAQELKDKFKPEG